MLRVLVKVRTFVNGATREVGEEITIMSHLFSQEVHTILEDLGLAEGEPEPATPIPPVESQEPAPPATKVSPPSPSSPATAEPAAPAAAASNKDDTT